ncbi:MAM and LDL-receptor class A domain-containing protein 2-like [Branchiostoma lanceolatum]|uniref:MAM and LDL-receptor class A domain-containing protein 2-like n=1 Tax=Branchiostoma lanceolatum TaxID=7740 RepID=UPI0034521538
MYVDASRHSRPGDYIRLLSPTYPSTSGQCLRFYYHMYGTDVGFLSVLTRAFGTVGPAVWTQMGDQGDQWQVAELTVSSPTPYQMVFEFISGTGQQGDIAIDDVSITDGACSPPGWCDFEIDQCTWSNEPTDDDFDWLRNSGRTITWASGPATDHTLGTSAGYYMYTEANGLSPGDKAWLVSQRFSSDSAQCLYFWYNMRGADMGTLNIYVRTTGGQPTLVSSLVGDQGSDWKESQVTVSASSAYQILLEGIIGSGPLSDIAVDDIRIQPGICQTLPTQPPQTASFGNCDFEQDMCLWRDSSDGSFQWRRDNNGTGTSNTGPAVDHTTGTVAGHYLAVEADDGNRNDIAVLTSPVFDQSSPTCQLSFWYHMYGNGIGTMQVILRQGNQDTQLFRKIGGQGNRWNSMIIGLGQLRAPFQILFEATRSFSVRGDIALDDINFINCELPPTEDSCTADQLRCTRGSCVGLDRVCDYTDDCGDGTDEAPNQCANIPDRCDFQNGICSWTQFGGDNFSWSRRAGCTPTGNTGPCRDHTTNTDAGYYLYIEASNRQNGNFARVASRIFAGTTGSTNPCTLRFYYHMYGNNIGSLAVKMRTTYGGPLTQIWARTSPVGNYWERAEIMIQSSGLFRLMIDGTVGNGAQGDIAIDDMSFTSGCVPDSGPLPPMPTTIAPPVTTQSPCQPGQFKCLEDNSCIDASKVCDYIMDCFTSSPSVMPSDEAMCGACTFERDQCGWTDISTGQYDWTRNQGPTSTANTGPSVDHTTQTGQGHYMYVEGGSGLFLTPAAMQSVPLSQTSNVCQVRFYYHMYGPGVGVLRLMLDAAGDGSALTELWRNENDMGDAWQQATVNLAGQRDGYRLQFQGVPSSSGGGGWGFLLPDTDDMAVDDITFIQCDLGSDRDYNCTFESGLCGWRQSTDDDFDWTRQQGATASSNTGPDNDHTTGTGYYVYVEASSPRQDGDVARLETGSLPATSTDGSCLSFWYHMFGPHIGSLSVHMQQEGQAKAMVWQLQGTQANDWKQAHISIMTPVGYRLFIEGTTGPGYVGDISLDDVVLTSGPCPATPECTFEADLCNWEQALDDDFDWVRHRNGTASAGTGPRYDHTYLSSLGYYLYMETSSPRQPGERVRLLSPFYDANNGEQCLQFWVHMFGDHVGDLNVYQQEEGQTFVAGPIWTKSGDQGNLWRFGRATLANARRRFRVVFEGVVGNGFRGDIALDDVKVVVGACDRPGFCDFERDTCGWTNELYIDDFDWLRDNGATPSLFTGPSVDHTTNTDQGYYLYIESSGNNRPAGENAFLLSESFAPTQMSCLSFWYHMYGAGVGSLNVLTAVYTGGNNINATYRWRASGNQGNVWRQGLVQITQTTQWELMFEGVYGGNYTGDIALDDIDVQPGACPFVPTTPTTPPVTMPPVYPPNENDCTFESDICSWMQDTNDDFDWSRASGSTVSVGTGPAVDHTTLTDSGFYMYIEASGQRLNDSAKLIGKSFTTSSIGVCMKFWYQMYGSSVGQLKIWARTPGVPDTVIWRMQGNRGPQWNYAQVHITADTPNEYNGQYTLQVVVEATRGQTWSGDIAVDDFSFNIGDCPATALCDFENDYCGYSQDQADDFDWTYQSGGTSSSQTGPSFDHTYGTPAGFYMYTEMSGLTAGDRARLSTQAHPATVGQCLQFWYHMYGSGIGTLNVYKSEGSAFPTLLWSMSGDMGDHWHVAQATVQSSRDFRITFEGVRGTSYRGDIAIDDILFLDSECDPLGSCDFEGSSCTWKNEERQDNFDWERQTGGTVSADTGPSADHTLGTPYGTYLYIETSVPQQQGDVAWMVSPVFDNSMPRCMNMWYHMKGQNIGALRVYMRPIDGSAMQLQWEMSMDMGDTWQLVYITFKDAPSSYEVLLEGVVGSGHSGDIAVDDLTFQENVECPPQPTTAPPCAVTCSSSDAQWPSCVPQTAVCDFNQDCKDKDDEIICGYDCTFENNDGCQWNETSTGTFAWRRHRGSTPDSNTGPPFDHTTLSAQGFYMYVDASSGNVYSYATLTSPMLQQASSTCELTFWYHMYGQDIGSLQVVRQQGTTQATLWELSGDQGNVWQQAVVYVGRVNTPFQLLVQARRGFNHLGDVAIDDVSFQGCALPVPVSGDCGTGLYKCSQRGACIDNNRVCDFTDDCGDNTDEQTCNAYPGRCDFEVGLCSWSQMATDEADWTRQSGPTTTTSTGPAIDHTTNTATGQYLYLESSFPASPGDRARLASTVLQVSPSATATDTCKLRFYYHMYGADIGDLSVYTRVQDGGPLTRVWSISGQVGDFFVRAEVDLQSPAGRFQVIIEGTVGSGSEGDIAIDDVSFSDMCQPVIGVLPIGTTPVPTTPGPPCPADQFHCGNGACIPATQYCDGTAQCSDGSDEATCGACTFETDLCGYVDTSFGSYNWQRYQANTPAATGPDMDHTSGVTGYYMSVSAIGGSVVNLAVLQSPALPAVGPNCQVKFWYYMTGTHDGHLSVYVGAVDGSLSQIWQELLTIDGSLSQIWQESVTSTQWRQGMVGIGRQEYGFKVEFEYFHFFQGARVALDDITFENCELGDLRPCQAQEFFCIQSGDCVNWTKICDYAQDCRDGSDEADFVCGSAAYPYERCDMETDLCSWTQELDDDFEWERRSGSTSSYTTGPAVDHTTGETSGYYIYIEASSPRQPGDVARISGPVILPTTDLPTPQGAASIPPGCQLRFWYHMYGRNIDTLNVYMRTQINGPLTTLWSKTGQQGDEWWLAYVDISSDANFQVVIEAVRGNGAAGDIAIDDVSFTPGCRVDLTASLAPPPTPTAATCPIGQLPCSSGECLSYSKFCDFNYDCPDASDELTCPSVCNFEIQDDNMCYWTNQASDDFDWHVHSGRNTAAGTGPTVDHTYNTPAGKYVCIEAASHYSMKAELLSPTFGHSGTTCKLNFWYHMYGANIDGLTMFLKIGEQRRLLWSASGDHGDVWNNAVVNIPPCTANFQVLFEGSIGTETVGNIALDDLRFQDCGYPNPSDSCSSDQFQCSSGHCISKLATCDYTLDCCDGSDESIGQCRSVPMCAFERDLCDWTQMNNDDFDWRRHRGHTSSDATGPQADHTSGSTSGYYLYVETSSPRVPGDVARIASFIIDENPRDCYMRFYYHMLGIAIGNLNVYIMPIGGSDMRPVDSIAGDQGDAWLRRNVLLNSLTPFQVVIEGVRGQGVAGDISIDDVTFTEGCSPYGGTVAPPTTTPLPTTTPATTMMACPAGQRPCSNYATSSQCVAETSWCDFRPDCGDRSDETDCNKICNFEGDNCRWNNLPGADMNWTRSTGVDTQGDPNSPTIDHTGGSNLGYFMYVDSRPAASSGVAELRSRTFNGAAAACRVEFAFFMYGSNAGTLELLMDTEGGRTSLWRATSTNNDNNKNSWQTIGGVSIGRRRQDFKLIFRHAYSGLYSGAVAVDDVAMRGCDFPLPQQTCAAGQWQCANGACIENALLCDLSDDCGDNSDESACSQLIQCNFEADLCTWQQSGEDDFDWMRNNGTTSTYWSGPSRDHTTGTRFGFYMFAETSSPQSYGDQAWLISPVFAATPDASTCQIRYWFHMYGEHVEELNVYRRQYNSGKGVRLMNHHGNFGDMWTRFYVNISSDTPYQIVMEAVVGDSYQGDIGIDDISFTDGCQLYPGQLPPPPATTSPPPTTTGPTVCTPTQYQCRNGQCIDSSKVCDFNLDCRDSSDEDGCVREKCDFNGGDLCGWISLDSDGPTASARAETYYRWQTGQGKDRTPSEASNNIRPGVDHSSGTQDGVGSSRPVFTQRFQAALSSGSTLTKINIKPGVDHTSGTQDGYYLFADSSPGSFLDTAQIITPMISRTGAQCVLSFWYFMHGSSIGSLHVYRVFGGQQVELFELDGEQGNTWKEGQIFLGTNQNIEIMIEARRGRSWVGDISIDDVQFRGCQPPEPDQGAQCRVDQFKCALGFCIPQSQHCDFVDDSSTEPDQGAQCRVDQFKCALGFCIPQSQHCDFVDDCGDGSDEDTLSGHCNRYPARCNFETDKCPNYWTDEAADDFDWTLRAGNTASSGTGPSTDHTNRDPTGHYIYIESSVPRQPGDKARIHTPPFRMANDGCLLRLFYHMYGTDVGSLNVYKRTSYLQSNGMTLMTSVTGDQGNFWRRLEVDFTGATNFEVVIEGVRGTGPQGDISIDDISMTMECVKGGQLPDGPTPSPPPTQHPSCPTGWLKCTNSDTCYAPYKKCDFIDDCQDGTSTMPSSDENGCGNDCTFESSAAPLCGWKNSASDNFDWTLHQGHTPSSSTGPGLDHTTNSVNGHYLYIESSTSAGVSLGDIAHITTGVYQVSSTTCTLRFWYHMYGTGTGILNVKIKAINNGLADLVWSKTGDQGNQWQQAEVAIGNRRQFVVLIEAMRGSNHLGDIAIDDISFVSCSTDPPPLQCGPNEFRCTSQPQCVSQDVLCDYKDDCTDGTDELRCVYQPGNCNFDNVASSVIGCGWTQLDSDDFDWSGPASNTPTANTGPSTTHNNIGRFLYIETSSPQRPGMLAALESADFPAGIGVCRMRFFYHMYGSAQMGALKVYTHSKSGPRQLMWIEAGNKGSSWQYASFPIGNSDMYKVVVEAEVGGNDRGDIAIDDISFSPGCSNLTNNCPVGQFYCPDFPYINCLPNTWLCDGDVDCPDGRDEAGCPTQSYQPTPAAVTGGSPGTVNPGSCGPRELTCLNGQCVSTFLVCDGVNDCSDNTDEIGCTGDIPCNGTSVYCGSTGTCLSETTRCDGTDDCSTGADEALCGSCPTNYCQNGGLCQYRSDASTFYCGCTDKFSGSRCQLEVISPPDRRTGTNTTMWIAIGLVVGVVVIVAVLLGVYFVVRRNRDRRFGGLPGYGTNNPTYEPDQLQDFKFSDVDTSYMIDTPDTTYMIDTPRKLGTDAAGIDNPLYGMKKEADYGMDIGGASSSSTA